MAITEILPGIHYVGVNDRTTTRFEALWSLPMGVSYNAYLVAGEKIALIDTVEESFGSRLEANIREAIGERKIDYLVVNHMEPDHSSSIAALRRIYPDIEIVGNAKTLQMIQGFYGIDTDTRDQLIAANMTNDEMCEWMGADSLAFISLQGLRDSLPDVRTPGYCEACFSGEYPVDIPAYTARNSFMTKADFAAAYEKEAQEAENTQVSV